MTRYDYLVVGGGMTADAAARGIRDVDSSGTIGILSAEADAPYSRPPLSKALWKGETAESIWRGTESLGVTLHLARQVIGLDSTARVVTDQLGERYGYGSLLLATGGTPRRFAFPHDGVVYFRTLRDYRALRSATGIHHRFAVIGGGFIGSEIAAALRLNDKAVVMIVPEAGIGARIFPADLSRYVTDYYRQKGVEVRQQAAVSSVQRQGDRFAVGLADGSREAVDGVVAGLGIAPNVELAVAAGAGAGDGVDVDERLRTTTEGVFAAGDVARFHNPALGFRIRVEHEDNALTMGRAAGRSMAGDDSAYDHLPFFYSDLFDLGYEAVGTLDSRLDTFADWKEPFQEGVVYYIADRRVRGVLLWNVWGRVPDARSLIAEQGPHGPDTLRGRITA
jgi:NADPH-dependent 2,4-dienoyl-CoA reductase/sulfur reductase-like enzyme